MVSGIELKPSLRRCLDTANKAMPRRLLGAVLASSVIVLALGYPALAGDRKDGSTGGGPQVHQPGTTRPGVAPDRDNPRTVPGPSRANLDRDMTFELTAGGKLTATGTIVPGSAARFSDAVAKYGSSIKTVSLNSPGGSVRDAIAMGRLIRDKKFATEVESGHYCASACPLIFAGGTLRRAGPGARIGVHQISSINGDLSHDDGMASAQQITAMTESYLRDMGVDLGVWLHAMATPKSDLYVFTPKEMLELKLATEASADKTASTDSKPPSSNDKPLSSENKPPLSGPKTGQNTGPKGAQSASRVAQTSKGDTVPGGGPVSTSRGSAQVASRNAALHAAAPLGSRPTAGRQE